MTDGKRQAASNSCIWSLAASLSPWAACGSATSAARPRGIFPNYAEAHAAWKEKAQMTVDNAQMRYVIVHLHGFSNPNRAMGKAELRSVGAIERNPVRPRRYGNGVGLGATQPPGA
jgi:hypothetical protein